MTIEECVEYEVQTNWLVPFIWFNWGQRIMANYLVWRTKRKYKRYNWILDQRIKMKKDGNK